MSFQTLNFKYDYCVFEQSPLSDVVLRIDFSEDISLDSPDLSLLETYKKFLEDRGFSEYKEEKHTDQEISFHSDKPTKILESSFPFHNFVNPNNKNRVSFSRNFFIINTPEYAGFTEFKKTFIEVFGFFKEIFNKKKFLRIGLRYTNLFDLNKLNIREKDVLKYFNLEVMPELYNFFDKGSELYLSGLSKQLNYRIGPDNFRFSFNSVVNNETKSNGFMVDIDLYQVNKDGIEEDECDIISRFNGNTGRIFRQLITKEMVKLLQPKKQKVKI